MGTIGVAHAESLPEVPSASPDTSTLSKEYTICAPQLLHLDRTGRPLWFNGWLLENKFAEVGKKRPAKFEAYVQEEGGIYHWELKHSNVACLTANNISSLSQEENDALDMILAAGKRCEAF